MRCGGFFGRQPLCDLNILRFLVIVGGGGEIVPPSSSLSIIIVTNTEGRDGAAGDCRVFSFRLGRISCFWYWWGGL